MTGRGLQQLLLILSYLYSHKESILLIDEPDAHLEILRQKQVYEILKEVAEKNKCQVIIATHSEVILDDAVDSNLSLILNGDAVDLATNTDMKRSLRSFGIDHYVKAKINPEIIYIEGSTDLEILKKFADLLKHQAYEVLSKPINYYYTQNVSPTDNFDNRMEKIGGLFGNAKEHFFTLQCYVPELTGFGIFDSDNKPQETFDENNLKIRYWSNYEIENYFITPDLLLEYIDFSFGNSEPLFASSYHKTAKDILDQILIKMFFSSHHELLPEFESASKSMKSKVLRKEKMSDLADKFFQEFANRSSRPILLRKGQYHRLIQLLNPEDVDDEVVSVLDDIVHILGEES